MYFMIEGTGQSISLVGNTRTTHGRAEVLVESKDDFRNGRRSLITKCGRAQLHTPGVSGAKAECDPVDALARPVGSAVLGFKQLFFGKPLRKQSKEERLGPGTLVSRVHLLDMNCRFIASN